MVQNLSIKMGCGVTRQKPKISSKDTTETFNNNLSLRKYKNINPKYFKLPKDLYYIQETTPSKEFSDNY